nr:sodium-dependent transporter [Sphingomonas sp. Y57]
MMQRHQHWSSTFGFLLAAMGAAIGLGSVWKFPYMVGTGGGGAFVLIYLLAAATITVPILIAELMLGRRGQASPPRVMTRVASEVGASRHWAWLGIITVITIYLIGTYYSVIGGWIIAYVFEAASGSFAGATAGEIAGIYRALLADPVVVAFWHGLFMTLTILILMGGVQRGIERASQIMMPALFLMLILMVGYAAYAGEFVAALRFLFVPDFSALSADIVLSAVSLSFFSIGTGMAIMMTYGSYLTRDMSVTSSAIKIAASVPVVALMVGLAIFPLVFAHDLNPAEGPGLLFVTLPLVFGQVTGGLVFGTLFFILACFAALTSAIAGIEPIVAWSEERFGIRRKIGAPLVGFVAWLLGLGTVFSFNIWSDVKPPAGLGKYSDMTPYGLLDFATGNVMIPVANILICIFIGWIMPAAAVRSDIAPRSATLFNYWRLTLRYFAPIPLIVILIMGLT